MLRGLLSKNNMSTPIKKNWGRPYHLHYDTFRRTRGYFQKSSRNSETSSTDGDSGSSRTVPNPPGPSQTLLDPPRSSIYPGTSWTLLNPLRPSQIL